MTRGQCDKNRKKGNIMSFKKVISKPFLQLIFQFDGENEILYILCFNENHDNIKYYLLQKQAVILPTSVQTDLTYIRTGRQASQIMLVELRTVYSLTTG